MPKQFDRITKTKAQAIAGNAIKGGEIARTPCLVCGDPESIAHHPDYNKPRKVIFLCKKHHREIHRTMEYIPPLDKYVEGSVNLKAMLDNIEKAAILWALSETQGNQSAAAKYLGVSFRMIRYKIDYHRINTKSFNIP